MAYTYKLCDCIQRDRVEMNVRTEYREKETQIRSFIDC